MPHVLIVSAALFSIGLMAALSRRSAVFVLIGIELMLAAANINFVAFWRAMPLVEGVRPPTGVMFVMFAIAIAAAEVAVGMALVIAVFRHNQSTEISKLDQLKG